MWQVGLELGLSDGKRGWEVGGKRNRPALAFDVKSQALTSSCRLSSSGALLTRETGQGCPAGVPVPALPAPLSPSSKSPSAFSSSIQLGLINLLCQLMVRVSQVNL